MHGRARLFSYCSFSLAVFGSYHTRRRRSMMTPSLPEGRQVQLFPESEIKPGMKATAWTVFQGSKPEAVPIEIIGMWQNAWGPKQDIIVGKMGGKAQRTNVAGGMSGSPVYIDGKLVGAVSLAAERFLARCHLWYHAHRPDAGGKRIDKPVQRQLKLRTRLPPRKCPTCSCRADCCRA